MYWRNRITSYYNFYKSLILTRKKKEKEGRRSYWKAESQAASYFHWKKRRKKALLKMALKHTLSNFIENFISTNINFNLASCSMQKNRTLTKQRFLRIITSSVHWVNLPRQSKRKRELSGRDCALTATCEFVKKFSTDKRPLRKTYKGKADVWPEDFYWAICRIPAWPSGTKDRASQPPRLPSAEKKENIFLFVSFILSAFLQLYYSFLSITPRIYPFSHLLPLLFNLIALHLYIILFVFT